MSWGNMVVENGNITSIKLNDSIIKKFNDAGIKNILSETQSTENHNESILENNMELIRGEEIQAEAEQKKKEQNNTEQKKKEQNEREQEVGEYLKSVSGELSREIGEEMTYRGKRSFI